MLERAFAAALACGLFWFATGSMWQGVQIMLGVAVMCAATEDSVRRPK